MLAPASRAFPADPVAALKAKYGGSPTSGYRTRSHQQALIRQGLTNTENSSHTRGDGLDWAVPAGMSKGQFIAAVKRDFPGVKAIPSNGNSVHITFPGFGRMPDVSGSRRRYPD